jgi:hypothetical protein
MRHLRVVLSVFLVAAAFVTHGVTSIGQDMKREGRATGGTCDSSCS